MKRIFAAFAAVVLFLMGLGGIRNESRATMLRKDYATTRGVISSKEVGSHGVVEYTYEAGGAQYRRSDVGGDERRFGEATTVYYLPSDPSISGLHDPSIRATLGWPGVAMPFIVALGFIFIAARRSQPQT